MDSEKRASLYSLHDYKVLFEDYKANLQAITKHLEYIANLLDENQRIALMCYEENPEICHRHIIRDYLIEKHGVICRDL